MRIYVALKVLESLVDEYGQTSGNTGGTLLKGWVDDKVTKVVFPFSTGQKRVFQSLINVEIGWNGESI